MSTGTSDTVCPACGNAVVSWETECSHCGEEFPDGPVTLDEDEENERSTETATISLDRLLKTARDIYDSQPRVAIVGGVGIVVLSVLVVVYAVRTSLIGTAFALLVWGALTVVLARNGVTYRVAERSALAAALYLVIIPMAVRLVTKTALVAKANETPTSIHSGAATLLFLIVGVFGVWAVRTTPSTR